MNRRRLTFSLMAVLVMLSAAGASNAQQSSCLAPSVCSTGPNVTTSQIQIGGPGSVSSNNTVPATCDGGTPGNLISAQYQLSFDRAAGQLTIVATNTTQAPSAGALTGFGFNVTSDVTLMTLASQSAGGLTWSGAFDRDRTDGSIEVPAGSNKQDIKCDGFGRFNAFAGNKGVDTGFGGGDASEILPGNSKTFVFDVTGNLANVTACSFTSVASLIPPGDKTAIAIGRFQACNGGGSAWAGPCVPGNLLVSLVDFKAKGKDNKALVQFETASEIDTAGFFILRQDARTKQYVRVNENLIPGRGSETSGAVYTFEDLSAQNGKRHKYILEEIELDGDNNLYHPQSQVVVINPEVTPISLVSPAYEASISRSAGGRLSWQTSGGSRRFEIEISSDPGFAEASTLRLSTGSGRTRSLSRHELNRISDLASLSGEGGVYWRVKGKSSRALDEGSQTFFFYVTD